MTDPVDEDLQILLEKFVAGKADADAVVARFRTEANFLEVVAASQRNAAKIFDALDDEGRQSFARRIAEA